MLGGGAADAIAAQYEQMSPAEVGGKHRASSSENIVVAMCMITVICGNYCASMCAYVF